MEVLTCVVHIVDLATYGPLDTLGLCISFCVGHFIMPTDAGVVSINSLARSEFLAEGITPTPTVDEKARPVRVVMSFK